MPNPLPLVALPTDDVARGASVSMTTEDPEYPAENAVNDDPCDVAKSTGSSTTITITTASCTPVAVALINTNATTATINGASITIPAVEADGQRVHAWRTLSVAAGTSWAVALSRASGVVWIGRIVLVLAIHEFPLRYGLQWGRNRPGDIAIPLRLGGLLKVSAGIRTRWAEGETDLLDMESLRAQLDAAALGHIHPFLFIPDETTNDAWFGTFRANDFAITYSDLDVRTCAFRFEERANGPIDG